MCRWTGNSLVGKFDDEKEKGEVVKFFDHFELLYNTKITGVCNDKT